VPFLCELDTHPPVVLGHGANYMEV
jgi:hypothetical protein